MKYKSQTFCELQYELEWSVNLSPWLGPTSYAAPTILCFMSKKLFAFGSLTNEFQSVHNRLSECLNLLMLFVQIMGRRERKGATEFTALPLLAFSHQTEEHQVKFCTGSLPSDEICLHLIQCFLICLYYYHSAAIVIKHFKQCNISQSDDVELLFFLSKSFSFLIS